MLFCAGERRCEPGTPKGMEEDAGGELLVGLGLGPVQLEVWAEALPAAEALCAAEGGAAEDGGSGAFVGGLTGFDKGV